MNIDAYKILGVPSTASSAEIKAAYRELVKKHHPDAGGDQKKILDLNAAWELLGDQENRISYDRKKNEYYSLVKESERRSQRNARANAAVKVAKGHSSKADKTLSDWLEKVYMPIDQLLGQIINPFPNQIKALSADPYDDLLMSDFCNYLEKSRTRLEKVTHLFRSIRTPHSAEGFGLSLYHCLSQVEDALGEFERYTMGYIDSYLHDGKEMLREAKQRRTRLKEEFRRLKI